MNYHETEIDELYVYYEDPCTSKHLQDPWVIGPFTHVEEALDFGVEMFGDNERGIYWSFRRLEQHEISELITPDTFREFVQNLNRPTVDDVLRNMGPEDNHRGEGGLLCN